MNFFTKTILLLFLCFSTAVKANFILLPMDDVSQKNHLKAYGITYWCLDKQLQSQLVAQLSWWFIFIA
jgi:hypothetical protein